MTYKNNLAAFYAKVINIIKWVLIPYLPYKNLDFLYILSKNAINQFFLGKTQRYYLVLF